MPNRIDMISVRSRIFSGHCRVGSLEKPKTYSDLKKIPTSAS
jgi:hypothetical protein